MNDKILGKVEYTLVNGECKPTSERIVKETALTININGQRYATAMILADMEKEFVMGHLFTQGFIQKTANIRSLTINDNTAEVSLADMSKTKSFKEKAKYVLNSICLSRRNMTLLYPCTADSIRIYLFYVIRLKDLLMRYGRTLLKILFSRGERSSLRRREKLREWLTAT